METRCSISNQRKRLFQYIEDFYGKEPEYLWAKYPTYAVFRHSASRKWFAAVMEFPGDKLGLSGGSCVDVLNVKCDSVLIGSLLAEAGFFPAYHMNKNTWISVLLDETVPDERILPLLEWSYDAVAPKRKRRKQEQS